MENDVKNKACFLRFFKQFQPLENTVERSAKIMKSKFLGIFALLRSVLQYQQGFRQVATSTSHFALRKKVK